MNMRFRGTSRYGGLLDVRIGGPVALGAVVLAAVLSMAMGSAGVGKTLGAKAAEGAGRLAQDGPAVFRVFMDPAGSDRNDGRSRSTAVQSLAQVQRVIDAARPAIDVEVRIGPGVYVAPPIEWATYVPNRTITFLPTEFQYGEKTKDVGKRPIFRGNGSAGFWFRAVLPSGNTGGDTRLRFYYLQVERYSSGGILFDGGADRSGSGLMVPRTAGINGNTVYGMNFRSIGSKHVSSGVGFGALDLVNSKNNVIENNQFTGIENRAISGEAGLVHAVYMAHSSSGNVVQGNRFERVSGDPIRTRNNSSGNDITRNTFVRAGSKAFFSDWFVSAAKAQETRECPSTENKFHDNRLVSGYAGDVAAWSAAENGAALSNAAECGGVRERVRSWANRSR